MEVCPFCQIIAKALPVHTVYEDEHCLAFLDKMPRSKGMVLVVPKKHYEHFEEDFETSFMLFQSGLIVAKMLKDALQPSFVSIATFPSKVSHFHLRLYPFYANQVPLFETSAMEASEPELRELAERIRTIRVELVKEEKKVEEPKRGEEEVKWIRREMEMA